MLNNGKDDMGKFDPKSDEGVLIGYFPSSKADRVFNNRTLWIEESVHVIYDKDDDLKNLETKDNDDHEELFKIQSNEANSPEVEVS